MRSSAKARWGNNAEKAPDREAGFSNTIFFVSFPCKRVSRANWLIGFQDRRNAKSSLRRASAKWASYTLHSLNSHFKALNASSILGHTLPSSSTIAGASCNQTHTTSTGSELRIIFFSTIAKSHFLCANKNENT